MVSPRQWDFWIPERTVCSEVPNSVIFSSRPEELLHRVFAGAGVDQRQRLVTDGERLLGLNRALVIGARREPDGEVGAGHG